MSTSNVTPNSSQCLICLNKTESFTNSPGQLGKDEVVIERQLSVIYLVNKLLEIPSEVCANYLSNFGNPEEWISICADCCSFVEEGRQLFNEIQRLEQKHKEFGKTLLLKMKGKNQVILGQATAEIRNYLDILNDFNDDDELSDAFMSPVDEPLSHEDASDLHSENELPETKIERNVDFAEVEQLRILPKRAAAKNRKYIDEEEEIEMKLEPIDEDEADPLEEHFNDFDDESSDFEVEAKPEKKPKKRKTPSAKKVAKKEHKYKCDLCPFSYPFKQQLTRHLYLHEPEVELTEEERNAEQLTFDQVLKKHEELMAKLALEDSVDHGEEGRGQRGKASSLAHLALVHKVEEFPCHVCGKVYDEFQAWNWHYMGQYNRRSCEKKEKRAKKADVCPSVPIEIENLECEMCGEKCISADIRGLENHMRAKHLDPEVLKCKGCTKVYISADTYNNHYNKLLDTDPSSPCVLNGVKCQMGTCKKVARSSQEALAVHEKVFHTNKAPLRFKCVLCASLFAFKGSLQKHIASKHSDLGPNPFPCPKPGCSKSFASNEGVKRHIKGYHAPREGAEKKFKCHFENCTSAFHLRHKLVRHLKIHNPENPFVCENCGKGFKDRNYLTIHSWQHDPNMRHKYKEYRDNKLAKQRRLEQEQGQEQLNDANN